MQITCKSTGRTWKLIGLGVKQEELKVTSESGLADQKLTWSDK